MGRMKSKLGHYPPVGTMPGRKLLSSNEVCDLYSTSIHGSFGGILTGLIERVVLRCSGGRYFWRRSSQAPTHILRLRRFNDLRSDHSL